MNRFVFSGRILEATYTAAAGGKKSRAVVKVASYRKGAYEEIEFISFSPSAEFVGRGQGIIPIDNNGTMIQENKKGFFPGCRCEGQGYVKTSEYTDKNGVRRSSYQFIMEEISSDPYDQEAANWFAYYNNKKATAQQNPQRNAGYGQPYAGYQQNAGFAQPQMQPQMAPQPQMQPQVAQQMPQMAPQAPAQGGFRAGTMPQNMPGVQPGGFTPGFNPQQANKPGGYAQMQMPMQQQ